MIDAKYLPPPLPAAADKATDGRAPAIRSAIISEWARDRLHTIATSSPRSRQAELGPSEMGQACPRRLAYRITGTPVVNFPDPLKAMFGTGLHALLAEGLARLDGGTGRYLIEHQVSYRGITGRVDLHDRFLETTTDWKTTTVRRIRQYQRDGVPPNYAIQANIYAQGLIAEGETVSTIALVFIPRDGLLRDLWTWTTTPNADIADAAIDRYQEIAEAARSDEGVIGLQALPTNLCSYCPNYRPTARDVRVACRGKDQQ